MEKKKREEVKVFFEELEDRDPKKHPYSPKKSGRIIFVKKDGTETVFRF